MASSWTLRQKRPCVLSRSKETTERSRAVVGGRQKDLGLWKESGKKHCRWWSSFPWPRLDCISVLRKQSLLSCTSWASPPAAEYWSKCYIRYRISLIISRTFLHETSHPKNGVRLTIEMRLTFRISVKLAVIHAYTYTVYTKSHMQVSPDLVKGKFWNTMTDSPNWGCDL